MSLMKRIFSRKSEEDYETILSNLADDIKKRQLQLSEIRLRERRATLLVTLYTLAVWVAYVSVWYLGALPELKNTHTAVGRALKASPVVLGPIVILFIRRIVQIWYKRKGDAEEQTVKELIKQRREKVEEIKKKTNYYSTRDLIQKYDDVTPAATPLRPRVVPNQVPPATPQRQMLPNNGNANLQTPGPSAGLQAHLLSASPPFPTAPPRRQWYDKLADAILGDEDPNIGSPSSRYALICEKCFAHNGLVKESMWEDSQYVCPKCHHFNPSARTKRARGMANLSPPSSATSSPSHPAALFPPALQQRHASDGSQTSGSPPQSVEPDLPTVDAPESVPMEVDSTEGVTPAS